jgi:hypothetical protein
MCVGHRGHNPDECREDEQGSGGAFHRYPFNTGDAERYTATVPV